MSFARQVKTRRPSNPRPPTVEQLMRRLTARDLQILYTAYMARAISTYELSAQFWPNSPIDSSRTSRALRARLLELIRWKLVQREPDDMTPAPLVTSWHEPEEGPISPWGKVVTITNRGIRVLVRAGLIPESKVDETEGWVPAYATAAQVRPAPSQVDHAFMVSAAMVRATKDHAGSFRWWGTRPLDRAVHPENAILPDALLATPHHTWAVEADKGTISESRLLERWREQGPIWDEIRKLGIELESYELPPVAGVLWYCADRSEARLYGRMWRLRLGVLQFDHAIPPSLAWYVDSFDGMAWTWRRWLRPWTLGQAEHPQTILQAAVVEELGSEAESVLAIASLGNLTSWQAFSAWASQAHLRGPADTLPEWCVVLVRDELEARGIWYIAQQAGVQDRLLLVVDALTDDREAAKVDLSRVIWRHDTEWNVVGLKERVEGFVSGQRIELRSFTARGRRPV